MEMITIITQAATAVGLSPALLLSVCFTESNLKNTVVPHDGHSASWGMCQMKYETAKRIEKDIYPSHLMRPEISARIAAKYLLKQIKRYHGNVWCGVDAYNKGTTRHCIQDLSTKYTRKVKHHFRAQSWNNNL